MTILKWCIWYGVYELLTYISFSFSKMDAMIADMVVWEMSEVDLSSSSIWGSAAGNSKTFLLEMMRYFLFVYSPVFMTVSKISVWIKMRWFLNASAHLVEQVGPRTHAELRRDKARHVECERWTSCWLGLLSYSQCQWELVPCLLRFCAREPFVSPQNSRCSLVE